MALSLDTRDSEAIVVDALQKGERADDDILTKQARRVFDKVVNYSEKSGYDSAFYRQNQSAHKVKSERESAAQVQISKDDKAKAEQLSADLRAEAERQKAVVVPPTQETPPTSQPEKKKGFLSRFGL